MVSPLVPDYDSLGEYVESLGNMFGSVRMANTAYVFSIGEIPLVVLSPMDKAVGSHVDYTTHFFKELMTSPKRSIKTASIFLIEMIEDYLCETMREPKDTSKATLLWRRVPSTEIVGGNHHVGYCRILVLQ